MWPQFILITFMFIGLGVNVAKDGEPTVYDGLASLISVIITIGLLWWGGFLYSLRRKGL